jgi:hypothetical protein
MTCLLSTVESLAIDEQPRRTNPRKQHNRFDPEPISFQPQLPGSTGCVECAQSLVRASVPHIAWYTKGMDFPGNSTEILAKNGGKNVFQLASHGDGVRAAEPHLQLKLDASPARCETLTQQQSHLSVTQKIWATSLRRVSLRAGC